jgi:hypothetical protein
MNGARRIDPKSAKLALGRLLQVYEANLKTLDMKTIKTRQAADDVLFVLLWAWLT